MSQITGISSNDLQSQYLTLLTTQLQNQDPLEPTDSESFITQLSQLSTLENLQTLNANFSQMLKLQQLTEGASLIGKNVEYSNDSGAQIAQVLGLNVQNGEILLQFANESIKLDQISRITA